MEKADTIVKFVVIGMESNLNRFLEFSNFFRKEDNKYASVVKTIRAKVE